MHPYEISTFRNENNDSKYIFLSPNHFRMFRNLGIKVTCKTNQTLRKLINPKDNMKCFEKLGTSEKILNTAMESIMARVEEL